MEDIHFVLQINVDELLNITNCIAQKADKGNLPGGFYQISVWFADIANKLRNANCLPNNYSIFIKEKENFGNKSTYNHALRIWKKGLVPIEIVQSSGAIYYAIPKEIIDEKKVRNYIVLCAEEKIPKIKDFKDLSTKLTFEEICDLYRFDSNDMQYDTVKNRMKFDVEENIINILAMVKKVGKSMNMINYIKDMIFGEYIIRPCDLLEQIAKAIYRFDICSMKEDVPALYIDIIDLFRNTDTAYLTTTLITIYMGFCISENSRTDEEETEIYDKINLQFLAKKRKLEI